VSRMEVEEIIALNCYWGQVGRGEFWGDGVVESITLFLMYNPNDT